MSTEFRLRERVKAAALFDGGLEKFEIREHLCADTNENRRCLSDGRNFLWVYVDEDGFVVNFTRWGGNAVGKIVNAIAETFATRIYSEHEPQFWGFETGGMGGCPRAIVKRAR